jgi:actin-related protein 3
LSREISAELDFFIGEEAQKKVRTHKLVYPMSSGEVKDWNIMEKLWHKCIYDYLRCEPRDHIMMLTEPPMNPPENRESMAEIMFETFGFEGLHIGVQATLALYSAWYNTADEAQKKMGLTGTVVDSGDGVTHIIPMVLSLMTLDRRLCHRFLHQACTACRSRHHFLHHDRSERARRSHRF